MSRRKIDSAEVGELITQSGVRVEPLDPGGSLFDGDILIRFHLPDGRFVEYQAREESDYYGGSYTNIDCYLCEGES